LLVVSETDNFYAWLEVNPRAKGHTQVVPKEHKESILDFSPGEYDEAMRLVRKVVEKAEEGLGADGASVTANIGEAAGQMLPHAYISVFPRFQDEENAGTPTGAIFPQREELQQQLQDIHDSMSSVSVDFSKEKREVHPDSKRHEQENSTGGFSSNLVDREEVKKSSGEEKEPEEKKKDDEGETEEPGTGETSQEEAPDEEEEDEEEELEGTGHWDGKSFEWR
ncbi:MAG: HIT family protein, partial [Candidatus Nanohaloarchaea archaeon]